MSLTIHLLDYVLVRGTRGARPAPGIEPRGADLVVGKMSKSAWETTRLESYLRHGARDTLINCGAWTNMSVEHTARTAADKGFASSGPRMHARRRAPTGTAPPSALPCRTSRW